MRQGRYADLTPVESASLSNQLQTHRRREVRIFSDKTIALSGDLTISRGSWSAQDIRNALAHFCGEDAVTLAHGVLVRDPSCFLAQHSG